MKIFVTIKISVDEIELSEAITTIHNVKNPVHRQVYVKIAVHEHVKTVARECVFVKNTFNDNVPVKNVFNGMHECEKYCS